MVARPEDGRQDMAEPEKGWQERGWYVCAAGSVENGRRVERRERLNGLDRMARVFGM